jgi:hypothetical protein
MQMPDASCIHRPGYLTEKEAAMDRNPMRLVATVMVVLFLCGCNTAAMFSVRGYEQATSLKVDAVTLMGKATDPYENHTAEIERLKLDVEKAYEYAKGREKNEETTKQWAIIKDPQRNSLFGFLKRWQEKSTLSPKFIEEAQGIVADGFDAVIVLESGKRKPGEGQTP